MARRGEELREHILWAAKNVFLETGFERASMDLVAARAETSKRSLYAYFESKEKLFLAVLELVRGLVIERLQTPADYSDKPAEALTIFCSRYLETMLYGPSIRLCRITLAETSRFPEGASQYFDVLFTEVQNRLATYLKTTFKLSPGASSDDAERLLAQVLHPRFHRALFGIDTVHESFEAAPPIDTKPIRKAVSALLASLPPQQ